LLFDLQNYWIVVVLCAVLYVAISTFLQANIGGKNRLRELQVEMRQIQTKMSEAAKKRNEKEVDRLMAENMALTSKLMVVQMQFAVVILIVFFGFAMMFSAIEPGGEDDVKFALYDDGLAAHCDLAANDGIHSNCYAIPQDARTGAQVMDVYLKTQSGEQLARSGTEIYVEGGAPSDVWIQNISQGGLLDIVLGKTSYRLNVSAEGAATARGGTVSVFANAIPKAPQGAIFEASSNSGTFFYVDLPFTLPLLNIRRIIGSTGVLIFSAFVLSICYSLLKAIYDSAFKKKA